MNELAHWAFDNNEMFFKQFIDHSIIRITINLLQLFILEKKDQTFETIHFKMLCSYKHEMEELRQVRRQTLRTKKNLPSPTPRVCMWND